MITSVPPDIRYLQKLFAKQITLISSKPTNQIQRFTNLKNVIAFMQLVWIKQFSVFMQHCLINCTANTRTKSPPMTFIIF